MARAGGDSHTVVLAVLEQLRAALFALNGYAPRSSREGSSGATKKAMVDRLVGPMIGLLYHRDTGLSTCVRHLLEAKEPDKVQSAEVMSLLCGVHSQTYQVLQLILRELARSKVSNSRGARLFGHAARHGAPAMRRFGQLLKAVAVALIALSEAIRRYAQSIATTNPELSDGLDAAIIITRIKARSLEEFCERRNVYVIGVMADSDLHRVYVYEGAVQLLAVEEAIVSGELTARQRRGFNILNAAGAAHTGGDAAAAASAAAPGAASASATASTPAPP